MLPIRRVVLGQLLQQGNLLLSGLTHGIVVANHLQGNLRGSPNRRRTRPSTHTTNNTTKMPQNFPRIIRTVEFPQNYPNRTMFPELSKPKFFQRVSEPQNFPRIIRTAEFSNQSKPQSFPRRFQGRGSTTEQFTSAPHAPEAKTARAQGGTDRVKRGAWGASAASGAGGAGGGGAAERRSKYLTASALQIPMNTLYRKGACGGWLAGLGYALR